jgi:hypothetical protein
MMDHHIASQTHLKVATAPLLEKMQWQGEHVFEKPKQFYYNFGAISTTNISIILLNYVIY